MKGYIVRKWLNSVQYGKDSIFCLLIYRFNVNLAKANRVCVGGGGGVGVTES